MLTCLTLAMPKKKKESRERMFFQCLTLITTEESCLLHNDKTITRTHKDILAVSRFF